MSTEQPQAAAWARDRGPSDEYEPSDPPTKADWDYLKHRAERNKRRSRWGVFLGLLAFVIALSLGVGSLAIYLSQKDVPTVLDRQTEGLNKINEIVQTLQEGEVQRAKTSKGQNLELAIIVENLAGAFATAPYPDAGRKMAVQNLCSTAAQFRVAGGAPPADHCP